MKKMVKMSLVAALVASASAVSVQADDIEILSNGKLNVQIRPRYEMVDQDGKSNANAITNRLTIGGGADLFGTSWLSAYAEATNVSALNNNYHDGNNGAAGTIGSNGTSTATATVADAEQTRVTQAYIDAKFGKTLFRFGRQGINLDNQRCIGTVDWRQMPQTYDAYAIVDNSIENLSIVAAYITNVNRVFANTQSETAGRNADQLDTRTGVINVSYKVMPELKVTAYDYMIGANTGFEGTPTNQGVGSDTYGIALTGDIDAGAKLSYRAEYASQSDATLENSGYTGNPSVDADYMNFELNANISGILAGVQYEKLSGTNGTDGKTAFSTPLATLHAHNGWADMFLGTPATGLVDMNVMLGYTSKEFGTAKVIYHEFESDEGSRDYGTEWDAIYTRAVPSVKGLNGMLKYARYSADDAVALTATQANVDTTKFWAMLTYNFSTK